MSRLGITVPLEPMTLATQRDLVVQLASQGITDAWSSEVSGADAFSPLAAVSQWTHLMHLGTAIASVYTRGPATLTQSFAALAELAPGRVTCGIGVSSPAIVRDWNGIDFDRPMARLRDVLHFMRMAFAGERITRDFETFSVNGFRLARVPEVTPPIFVAGLRRRMLEVAGSEGDGAIVNWLSADDVKRVAPIVRGKSAHKDIVARIFMVPVTDPDTVRQVGRRAIAAYLTVPAYAAFHRWLGRGERLEPLWHRWKLGDRRGSLEAIGDDLIDELVVHGSIVECVERVREYVDNGVTVPVLAILPGATASPAQAYGEFTAQWRRPAA